MKKIMTIFGTRPEAIKMAPLVKELQKTKDLKPVVVITAQHREMLDGVLKTFEIIPDYDLDIMEQNQTLSKITSKVITKLDSIIQKEKPDMILVHGDTMTTFAGGLAAFYNQISIGHVEAGLRTWDKYSPFPEEMNRQMVGIMSDLNFAPTNNAAQNLRDENKPESTIVITGNTAIDAMETTIKEDYYSEITTKHKKKRVILLTAHRRENIGEPMHNIFKAVRNIADQYEDVVVVYPMHKNPKVREIAEIYLKNHNRIELIEPLDVIDFHNFANQAYLILTDSGGVQEEAPSLGKPVLVLRDSTERPEGVKAGTLKVIGTSEDAVFEATQQLLEDESQYAKMSEARNPYGGPDMAVKSVEKLMDVPIDHYASINMDSVSTLIDEINGVDVVSNGDFKVRDYVFEKGKKHHMNGDEALAFMRSRKEAGAGGDEGRQARQQLVIEAVANKSLKPSSIPKINTIFDAVEDNVQTNLSLTELNDIRSDYQSAQETVNRHTLNGENTMGDDGLYYFYPGDNEKIIKDYKDNLKLDK